MLKSFLGGSNTINYLYKIDAEQRARLLSSGGIGVCGDSGLPYVPRFAYFIRTIVFYYCPNSRLVTPYTPFGTTKSWCTHGQGMNSSSAFPSSRTVVEIGIPTI